jgi:hypothetical protein
MPSGSQANPIFERYRIRFAAGLPEQILHDTPAGPSALPILEYALTGLWKRQERGIITTEAYRDIGGVEGALARSAERALWQRVDESERLDVERVLIQMVRPGEQPDAGGRAPDTRRVASHDEFGDREWRLIHRLASTRLVTITRQLTGPDTAELAHEALLEAWPRLAGWVDANRAFRTWQEELRRSMRQWRDHEQDARFVLDEPHIADALEWQWLRRADLTQAERDFIEVSVAAAARRRRRRRYRFGVVAWWLPSPWPRADTPSSSTRTATFSTATACRSRWPARPRASTPPSRTWLSSSASRAMTSRTPRRPTPACSVPAAWPGP